MPTIGPPELIVVLVIALLVSDPERFPETGRSLGQVMRGFRRSCTGADRADGRRRDVPAQASPIDGSQR